MADATIDPNANARHKDIRSFMTEKGKSEDKLFGLNKIFMEIKADENFNINFRLNSTNT